MIILVGGMSYGNRWCKCQMAGTRRSFPTTTALSHWGKMLLFIKPTPSPLSAVLNQWPPHRLLNHHDHIDRRRWQSDGGHTIMRPQVVCNLFPAVQCDAQSHWSKLACNVTQRRKVGGVSAAKVKNQHFARSFLRRLPSRPTLPHTCQRCSHAQCSRPNLSHL